MHMHLPLCIHTHMHARTHTNVVLFVMMKLGYHVLDTCTHVRTHMHTCTHMSMHSGSKDADGREFGQLLHSG